MVFLNDSEKSHQVDKNKPKSIVQNKVFKQKKENMKTKLVKLQIAEKKSRH